MKALTVLKVAMLLLASAGIVEPALATQALRPFAANATASARAPATLQAAVTRALAADGSLAHRPGTNSCADPLRVALKACLKATAATLGRPGDTTVKDKAQAFYPFDASWPWAEQKLLSDDGGSLDAFGWSFAVEGNTALIGAYYATVGSNRFQGAVYVFTESGGTWTQVQKLTASDGGGGDNFGTAVVLDGNTALIGAPAATITSGVLGQGAAYVFTNSGGVWSESQKLIIEEGHAVESFGISVTLEGDTALIGAHGTAVNGHANQGAVYVFTATDGIWSRTQQLVASDGAAQDQFGQQLALDGDTALIGSDQATYANDYPGPGAAYVFERTDGVWNETQRLSADDGVDADYFGRWVALAGTTALIGAPAATVDDNPFQGAIYAYAKSGGSWAQTQKILAGDGAALDFYGDAVAIDGSTAVVGAPGATINGNGFTGAVYVLSLAGGVWGEVSKITPSDGAYGDEFGYAVALRGGDTVFGGAPHPTDDGSGSAGAAYVYSYDRIFADGFDTATP